MITFNRCQGRKNEKEYGHDLAKPHRHGILLKLMHTSPAKLNQFHNAIRKTEGDGGK